MERLLLLQGGPTNTNASSTFFVEQQNVEDSLVEQVGGEEGSDLDCSTFLANTKEEMKLEYWEEEEETQQKSLPFPFPSLLLEDKMPFLQMLQSVESSLPLSSSFTHQPHLQQLLYTLEQQQKKSYFSKEMELESCITHETKEDQHFNGESSNSGEEEKSYCNKDQGGNWVGRYREYNSEGPPPPQQVNEDNNNNYNEEEEGIVERRKKRKRSTRPSKKNKEEVETQRMTHIAVERNRRKQMNDHLNVLRSLMPPSFVQRGDQASIIGGAIDFVKELEQHLQSLEAQKRTRSSSSKSELQEEEEMKRRRSFISSGGFFTSPQYTSYSSSSTGVESDEHDVNMSRMGVADIEVTVIQSHVNLKILSPRRPGQLLRAIASFEDIRLTVLHLNVTSFDRSVLYSFNLKIEDECELGSADEIAAAVYHIFSYIKAT